MPFQLGNKINVGTHLSSITKEKIRKKLSGKNNPNYGKHPSLITRKKISDGMLGKQNSLGKKNRLGHKLSPETKERIRQKRLGYKPSEETLEKIRGKNNHNWKGGISRIDKRIRSSKIYQRWRLKVLKRDKNTCQICNRIRRKLHAHHIKSFMELLKKHHIKKPKLAFVCSEFWDIKNGLTVCIQCHYGEIK